MTLTMSRATAHGLSTALALSGVLCVAAGAGRADEGGVSFWAPGQFSSLAAVPGEPGWAFPVIYYSVSADADASKNFLVGGNLTLGLDATGDLLFFFPTYTFEKPVLGGQAAFGAGWALGHLRGTADLALTDPQGNAFAATRSDAVTGGSDVYGLGTIKWNNANKNYVAYAMAGVPVGAYQLGRLANLGVNHWSIDAGGGLTYLDTSKGNEFSIVGGITYNFENGDTDYQNGIDSHVDWAASKFLNQQVHVGVVGYFYYQLTGDSGSGATLGDFKSRVSGIGPQVGYFFPFGGEQAYVNFKGYWEFDAENRAEGWNVWVSLALPFGAGK
jgi:hypothetical protein